MAKKVIIIDDSVTQLNILKSAFASNGWEVYGAQNVQDGWEMIFDAAPDLIVTDAIMPKIGGFQLVKAIRENNVLSKIPVIIYSILSENNAKYYIGKSEKDYFFTKTDDVNKLLNLALEVVSSHPLNDNEKIEILKSNIDKRFSSEKNIKPIVENIFEESNPNVEAEDNEKEHIKIDSEKLSEHLKNIYNFSYSDEKIMGDFFSILYPNIAYDLFMVNIFSFEKEKNILYFDIRDVILSPVFQKKMLDEYCADDVVLYKNYTPNLKMIVSEEEFYSKIEFSFEYRDKNIAKIAFYSKEKGKWDNIDDLDEVKKIFYNFFKARYINKNLTSVKHDLKKDNYSNQKFDLPFLNKPQKNSTYIAIIEIQNFDTLEEELSEEDLDIINLKISEKIIKCLDINEQIYKNAKDEYVAMIIASDDKQAYHKLNFIVNSINSIMHFEYFVDAAIGASNCIINDIFDVVQAQKTAKDALDFVTKQEKVVIKNARKQHSDEE